MLLSTLRALNALASSEEDEGYHSAETVRLPPRPAAEARELERVAAEIWRLSKRIDRLMKEGDRLNKPYYALLDCKNKREQSYRGLAQFQPDWDADDDAQLAELQQAFDERNMQVHTLKNELSRLIEQWRNLKGKGHPPVHARATLMSSNSPRDSTEMSEQQEMAYIQETIAELNRRRDAMEAKQTRIAAERCVMDQLQETLAQEDATLQRLVAIPREQQDGAAILACSTGILSIIERIRAHQRRIDDIWRER
jgi:hypothetical protein